MLILLEVIHQFPNLQTSGIDKVVTYLIGNDWTGRIMVFGEPIEKTREELQEDIRLAMSLSKEECGSYSNYLWKKLTKKGK